MEATFSGFPASGLQFFAELAQHNDRPWFEAHRQTYLDCVLAPAQAFVSALGERLRALSPEITYDTRTTGTGSIRRIYRDIRFSADKTPYRTSLGMTFGPVGSRKGQGAGYLVQVDAEGAEVYAGLHTFAKEHLAAYRRAVVDEERGAALEAAIAAVAGSGLYGLGGETLKRIPAGYDAGQPRAELLRYTALHASSLRMPPAVVTAPEFVDACEAHCRAMFPLYQWLGRLAP